MKLWLRVGDAGDYEPFADLTATIDYLNELHVGEITGWVASGAGIGIETVNYHGYDFISLYYGDNDANLIRQLFAAERTEVETGLIAALI